jgi:sec-independent protein translocase protein TatB
MFEVGFQELVMIALLALIVLGPEKLPKLAAQLGRWTGRARSMARNLRQQLEQEVSYDELLKQKQQAEDALRRASEAPMNFHHDVAASINSELTAASVTEPPVKEVPVPEVALTEAKVESAPAGAPEVAIDPVK